MSELSITNADELDVMSGDATVVVIMDDEVDVITTMEQGPPGPPGPPGPASIVAGPPGATGPAGPRGNSVLYGAVDPASGTGVNGDFYINTTTHFMFGPKTSGLWGAGYSIIGPAGPQGPTGPQGPIGLQGPVGPRGTDGTNGNTVLYGAANPTAQGVDGDFYINTTTSFIFGPKAGGAWPGGTSLVGPQGPRGDQGVQGVQGPKGDTGNTGPQGPSGTATLLVADTPPAGAADGSLWFESDTGLVYAMYNDGTSRQWVIITPQPDLSGYLPLDGGRLTGPVTFAGNTGGTALAYSVALDGAATHRAIAGMTNGSMRWRLDLGNSAAETGANEGSDLYLQRYDDTGGWIDNPIAIDRGSGAIAITGATAITGTLGMSATINTCSGQGITLTNTSSIYSDANYFGIGENGSVTLATAWKYMFARTTGARSWIDFTNTTLMTLSPAGSLTIKGTLAQNSDGIGKRDVKAAQEGIAEVRLMQPRHYHRINPEPPEDQPGWRIADREELGFIAQEMQVALPIAVVEHEDRLAIELMPLIATLTNAVKQLDAQVASLTARVQALEEAASA